MSSGWPDVEQPEGGVHARSRGSWGARGSIQFRPDDGPRLAPGGHGQARPEWLASREVYVWSHGRASVQWRPLEQMALLPEVTGRLESLGIRGMRTAAPNNQMQRMGRGFGVSSLGKGCRIAETPHR